MKKKDQHASPPLDEENGVEADAPVEEVAAQAPPDAEEKDANGDGVEALQSRLLRLQADFDNFRKRTQRERGDVARRALEDLLLELLPVIDHFEMGLATAQQHDAEPAVVNGLQLVYDQLMKAFEKFGLTPIDAEGEVFDPHLHEAATHLPSAEHPEDTVIAQTRRGYQLGDRLLRAAQVVVSSGAGETAEEPVGAEDEAEES